MKNTFELKTWMGENREVVISKYEALKNEKHFSGISLKNFMIDIMAHMEVNNIKSEKRAVEFLPRMIDAVSTKNVKIEIGFDRDAYRASKTPNGQWAAIL